MLRLPTFDLRLLYKMNTLYKLIQSILKFCRKNSSLLIRRCSLFNGKADISDQSLIARKNEIASEILTQFCIAVVTLTVSMWGITK